jgi:urease accessory protein
MRAEARLTVRRGRSGMTVPTELYGTPPYYLRQVGRPDALPLHIRMAGSCAGPLGGDQATFDIDVGPGAALRFTSVAAAIALPSSDRVPSHTATRIRVGTGGRLLWAPQHTIYGPASRHHTDTTITLNGDAGLIHRETIALGIHGGLPAEARAHTRVTLDGKPLWDQETALGEDVPGGGGPAVNAGARVLQQTLLVRPDLWWDGATHQVPARLLAPGSCLLPLAGGPALLISVQADQVEEATRISARGLAAAGLPMTDTGAPDTEARDTDVGADAGEAACAPSPAASPATVS